MNYEMLDRNKLNELDDYIASFEDKPSHLIMILHRAQGLFGYLPKELQIYIAEKTGVPAAKVYGVVTFYSFFTMKPKGRHTISFPSYNRSFGKAFQRVQQGFDVAFRIGKAQTDANGALLHRAQRLMDQRRTVQPGAHAQSGLIQCIRNLAGRMLPKIETERSNP